MENYEKDTKENVPIKKMKKNTQLMKSDIMYIILILFTMMIIIQLKI